MTDRRAPDEIFQLAVARSRARRERDWTEADRLKADIEAAGWRVVDRGTQFRLQPAVPPDVVEDGLVRYGSSAGVPSRLAEPPSSPATIVILPQAVDDPVEETALRALSTASSETTVVAAIPADGRSVGDPRDARLEVVRTAVPMTPGALANAGFRRAVGEVVVLLVGGALVAGDVVGPLVRALADPSVAVAGGRGSVTGDLRHLSAVGAGDDADVILPPCLAFRRDEGIGRGPFDERFMTIEGLFTWWSLVLRDGGPEVVPRRAVVAPDVPIGPEDTVAAGDGERDRARRRDFYRLLEGFGKRPDLTRGRAEGQ